MTTQAYMDAPWKNSHSAYEDSFLAIRPAPEYSTSEVLISSVYRASGFARYTESAVPKAGRDFEKLCRTERRGVQYKGRVSVDAWRTVLSGVLDSPKPPNQSSKRYLQLSPVVPDTALYSGSARLAGNPWNPGALVQRLVAMGAPNRSDAEALWQKLFNALTVGPADDVWALWLQSEFEFRAAADTQHWRPVPLPPTQSLPDEDKVGLSMPSKQFARDLAAVCDAKDKMTRRQWISLLESVIRLGCVMHVIWLCDVNHRAWQQIIQIFRGAEAPDLDATRKQVVSGSRRYLSFGNAAAAYVKEYASNYLEARIGINLVLWHLEDLGHPISGLSGSSDLQLLLSAVEARREQLAERKFWDAYTTLSEAEAKTIACKKGVGSNMVEFARHCLGQRQTADERLRGYDQGYILKKRGQSNRGAWIVSLGPVAVLSLVHCCLREAAGPRSVRTLCEHLGSYGLEVDLDDASSGDLGKTLRMLGLVLDSPDAESGMLLVPPF